MALADEEKRAASASIRAENLVKIYDENRVVDDVSIRLAAGEVVGLLGPNGAGKSTTFKMLVGFTRPSGGTVFFNERDISRLPIYQRARLGIGYLAQETSIFRHMTVRENLLAVLQARGARVRDIRARMRTLLDELGVAHLKERRVKELDGGGGLSGGETRRVEIARALMTNPTFLFMDEPFTGIDPKTVEDIQGIIGVLKSKGLGILITDHNIRETLQITDRSYILLQGKVIAEGSVRDIVDNPTVQERFLTDAIRRDLTGRMESNAPAETGGGKPAPGE